MSQALAGTAAAVDALMAFVRCKMESPSRSTTVRGSAAVTEGCRPSVGGSIGNPARHGETLCRRRQASPKRRFRGQVCRLPVGRGRVLRHNTIPPSNP